MATTQSLEQREAHEEETSPRNYYLRGYGSVLSLMLRANNRIKKYFMIAFFFFFFLEHCPVFPNGFY